MATRHPISTHLVWALVAVVAFAIGFFSSGDSPRRGAGVDPLPILKANAEAPASDGGSRDPAAAAVMLHDSIVLPVLSPEKARTLTFELLSEPNRLERWSRLCELLHRITAENWRDVMDGFVRQTAFEGREHGEEWKLMLQRVGEVVGPEAVLDALTSTGANKDHRARNTLEGWTMARPDEALAWLREQSPEYQQVLIPAMLYGLARSSPVQALEFALTQSNPEWRDGAIPDIVNGAVQQGGFAKAEQLLASVMNRPDIDPAVKTKLFEEFARKRITMARLRDRPMDSLAWLDGYLGGAWSVGPNQVGQMVRAAAAIDPFGAVQWVEQRGERLSPIESTFAYAAALQGVYRKAPEQFVGWLTDNPSHPAHDMLVETYVNDLIGTGRVTEVGRWLGTVQSDDARQRIQKALDKYSQQQPNIR